MFRTMAVLVCVVPLLLGGMLAQTVPAANTDPAYQALRNLVVGADPVTVDKLVLRRDAGTFTLSGTLCFAAPVEGKVTGAVFSGSGTFQLDPPLAVEKTSLSRLTKQPGMTEEFEQLVLRFTDATYDELKRAPAAKPAAGACDTGQWNDIASSLRKDMMLKWNLNARVLQDIYSQAPGGFFAAFIKGKKYNGKEIFIVDPHGVTDPFPAAPEEVMFTTWDANKFGVWAAFHLASEYAAGKATGKQRNAVIRIETQDVDLTVEKSGRLIGKASTTFIAEADSVRVVPFDLYRTLRVQSVTDGSGQTLNFIQEDKDEDAQFWVVLPKALAAAERFTIVTSYSGKDALLNEGSGNYYLAGGARDSWYPSSSFQDYASYQMRFTFPKDFKLVASGTLVNEVTEGSQTISQWRSEQPQTVAAFQLGKFKKEGKTVQGITLETYANFEVPDNIRALQQRADFPQLDHIGEQTMVGSISTTGMAKKAMAEAELATQLYSDYFGPAPFKRLAVTQQTADYYGQSWPELVWLPISYFFDNTIRFQLYGFDPRGYFKVVGPHEIAHQWWGHTVTWGSYRDQWMSEGFSETSASIFLQVISKDPQAFIKFWNDERDLIVERNKEGFRPVDVGPVTLGYRLNNTKVGNVTHRLIYPKGGYIVHMLRMMMWNARTGDAAFKQMMRDFVATYRNKAATTEDFKAVVEKHMTREMDLAGNRRMDWYFNEYVYGTALPVYRFDYTFDGMVLNFKVGQSNVSDDFRMLVPIYLEMPDGRIFRFGTVPVAGNTTFNDRVDLAALGLKEKPKRALLNYYDDVLCEK